MGAIRKSLGFIGRSYFPFKRALSLEQMRGSVEGCKSIIKGVYAKPQEAKPETFDEALARMQMTEQDLQARVTDMRLYFRLFFIVSLGLFFYAFYLLFSGYFSAFLLGFAVSALSGAFAFKQHFWLFQVQQRRLGCTLGEWWAALRGKRGNKPK